MIISLIGFMGCGKSSVGKELKRLLSCDLIDLDDYVENMTGRRIPEIFETDGEEAFRELEYKALEEIFSLHPAKTAKEEVKGTTELILCLGGGTLTKPAAADLVKSHCRNFYLRASVDELVTDLEGRTENRPLLKGKQLRSRVTELLSTRENLYETAADEIIDVEGLLFPEIADRIIRRI